MSGIDQPRGVVNDKPGARKTAFAGNLDQIFSFCPDVISRHTEYADARVQNEWLEIFYLDLARRRENLVVGVHKTSQMRIDNLKFVVQKHVIACGLETFAVKPSDRDIFSFQRRNDVFV